MTPTGFVCGTSGGGWFFGVRSSPRSLELPLLFSSPFGSVLLFPVSRLSCAFASNANARRIMGRIRSLFMGESPGVCESTSCGLAFTTPTEVGAADAGHHRNRHSSNPPSVGRPVPRHNVPTPHGAQVSRIPSVAPAQLGSRSGMRVAHHGTLQHRV